MVEPLRHRQTKGAATDMFYLTPPRHISTLPNPDFLLGGRTSASAECGHWSGGQSVGQAAQFCLARASRIVPLDAPRPDQPAQMADDWPTLHRALSMQALTTAAARTSCTDTTPTPRRWR